MVGDDIGTLSAYKEIKFDGSNNTIDAAIAESSTANLGNATPSNGYGTPGSVTEDATVDLNVMKYGRTTKETKAKVIAINATLNVNYGSPGVARFVNQIIVGGGGFSRGGDSGSLVVTQAAGHNPVGLLFAGASSITILNPIDDVLTTLNVTIDGA